MSSFKRIVSILLLVSIVLTNNGMFTFANQLGETLFETDENDKKDYSFGEQNESEGLTTVSNVLASNSENMEDNIEDEIICENEPEEENDNIENATLSEAEEIDLEVSTESQTVELETPKSTKSNTKRKLDDLDNLIETYFGEENFYDNSNEWNEDQKQLFEFHKIRDAWEYIYEHRNEEMKNRKIDVAVFDHFFAQPLIDNPNIVKNENGEVKVWSVYNDKIYRTDVPSYYKSIKGVDAKVRMTYTHGANVVSIIGEKFNNKNDNIGTKSLISGVASGYSNDLINIHLWNLKGFVNSQSTVNFTYLKNQFFFNFLEDKNIPIKVLNASVAFSPTVFKSDEVLNDNGFDTFFNNYKKVSVVNGVGNDGLEMDSDLFLDSDNRALNDRVNKLIDETIFVGALQTSYNISRKDNSSKICDEKNGHNQYGDCYYYADYSNTGDIVDVYACANNLTGYSKEIDEERFSGTSSATPVVSGIVALMYYMNPDLNPRQVKNILYKTSNVIDEGLTKDRIRVINAAKAVKEAHIIKDAVINDEDRNRVVFKKTKYIMNDRGNAEKVELNKEDYKENSIALFRPYFYNCKIDDYENYSWRIKEIDNIPYTEFNTKHQGMYNIDGSIFWIDKNKEYDDEADKLSKHIVKLEYVCNNNSKPCEEIIEKDEMNGIDAEIVNEITIEIYPNEHIIKNSIRKKGITLGAEAFINPYRMVGYDYPMCINSDKFTRCYIEKPSETNYNRDTVEIIVDGSDDDDFDDDEWSRYYDVVETRDDSILLLPDYSHYRDKYGIKILGINDPLSVEDLAAKNMKAYGFPPVFVTTDDSIDNVAVNDKNFNEREREYAFKCEDSNLWYKIKDFTASKDTLYVDYKIASLLCEREKKETLIFTTFKILTGPIGSHKVLVMPKKNILFKGSKIVILPDEGNNEEIKLDENSKNTISKNEVMISCDKTNGTNTEYRLDFDITYNENSLPKARIDYLVFPENSNVRFDSNKGYTCTHQIERYGTLADKSNITTQYRFSSTNNNNLAEIYSLIENEKKEVYLCILRSGEDEEDSNTIGSHLIRVRIPENKKISIDDFEKVSQHDNNNIKSECKYIKNINEVSKETINCHGSQIIVDDDKNKLNTNRNDKKDSDDKTKVIMLKDLYDYAGISQVNENGVLAGGEMECEHGEVALLRLTDFINLDYSYNISVIRKDYSVPKGKSSDKHRRYGMLYRMYIELFYKYVKFIYGDKVVSMYKALAEHTFNMHSEYNMGIGEYLSCCEVCKEFIGDIHKAAEEYRYFGTNEVFLENIRGMSEVETVKYGISTLSNTEITEIKRYLENIGFDIEKMSAGETDFQVVLETFINDTLSDRVISFNDFAKYLKVDITELAPTYIELVDKNYVGIIDNGLATISECYFNELEDRIDLVLAEPEEIINDRDYSVMIERVNGGYLYKYKVDKKGRYNFVTYNNGYNDPYLELYTLKDGNIDRDSYVADDNSLYNKNAIITKELEAGECIYIRCSLRGEETGKYSIAVIEEKEGKKPIIGENYSEIRIGAGEYYLYNDIRIVNSSMFTNGNVKIDLNGHTLTGERIWYSAIEVKSGELSIGNGTVVSQYGYDIYVNPGTKLNVESGNYYSTGNYDSVWGGNAGEGKVLINGGTFSKMPNVYEVKNDYEIVESKSKVKDLVLNYKLKKKEYVADIKIGGNKDNFEGYVKINVDLNEGSSRNASQKIYMWYKKTADEKKAIKDLKLSFNENGVSELSVPGYSKIAYNLNEAVGGDTIILWYTKSGAKPIKRIEIESFHQRMDNKDGWKTAIGNRNYKHIYTKTDYKNETRWRTVARTKYKQVAVTKYRTVYKTIYKTVAKVVWKKVKSFFGFFKALFTWKWKSYIEYVKEPVTITEKVPYTVYEQRPYTVYEQESYVVQVPITNTYAEVLTDTANYADLNKKAGGAYIYLRYQY